MSWAVIKVLAKDLTKQEAEEKMKELNQLDVFIIESGTKKWGC